MGLYRAPEALPSCATLLGGGLEGMVRGGQDFKKN